MTHRIKRTFTQFKSDGHSGVIAAKRSTRSCHWVQDELPN